MPTKEQFKTIGDTEAGKKRIFLWNITDDSNHTKMQSKFWTDFALLISPIITRIIAKTFAPELKALFGNTLNELFVGGFNLFESVDGIVGAAPPHTHFHHSPTHIANCLLYIDDDNCEERGTTIYGLKEQWQSLEMSSRAALDYGSVGVFEGWECRKKILFRGNRLFALLETPQSWHGVEDFGQIVSVGPRRMIRFNVAVGNPDLVRQFYPVDHYVIERTESDQRHIFEPSIVQITKKLRQAESMSDQEAETYVEKIVVRAAPPEAAWNCIRMGPKTYPVMLGDGDNSKGLFG